MGSLPTGSINRLLAKALVRLAPAFERGLITDDGAVTNKSTEDFLLNYITEFHSFIERVYTILPRLQ